MQKSFQSVIVALKSQDCRFSPQSGSNGRQVEGMAAVLGQQQRNSPDGKDARH